MRLVRNLSAAMLAAVIAVPANADEAEVVGGWQCTITTSNTLHAQLPETAIYVQVLFDADGSFDAEGLDENFGSFHVRGSWQSGETDDGYQVIAEGQRQDAMFDEQPFFLLSLLQSSDLMEQTIDAPDGTRIVTICDRVE